MVFGMIYANNINSMQRIYPAESGKSFTILIIKKASGSILVEDKKVECKSRSFFRGSLCSAKNVRFKVLKIPVGNETTYQGRGKLASVTRSTLIFEKVYAPFNFAPGIFT